MPGTPSVESEAPQVLTDPRRDTDHFAVNVARQCDFFRQVSVRKVDILWVIDSSGSMAPKQERLAANFQRFISQLSTANPPIDFRIAVISTDTDSATERGTLHGWSLNGCAQNFIACTPQQNGSVQCNTGYVLPDGRSMCEPDGGVVAAFRQMAGVGTAGSAQERGLYAAYLALTNPLNIQAATDAFIRPDAALYVVIVSDEDDSSCSPLTRSPVCTADPGCRCASDSVLEGPGNIGSTAWYTRFFETYKGFNNTDLVAVAAIISTDDGADGGARVPSQFLDTAEHVGCCRNTTTGAACTQTTGTNAGLPDSGIEVAYYGARYQKVANETGGVTVNICQSDFSGALSALGYAASGLREEFRLSRGPVLNVMGNTASGVEAYVSAPAAANCSVDGNCPPAEPFCRQNRCAKKVAVSVAAAPGGASYLKCDGTSLRNIIRFDGVAVPESLSTIEVCYDVQANFQNSCP